MADPGRNEPCPCGSGKKYKKCCLSRVRGVLVPATPLPGEPRNLHYVQHADGTTEERPGSLFVQIIGEQAGAPDAELRDSFQPYLARLRSRADLAERVRDCQHKCRAVDYHFRAIRAEIERQVDNYSKEHKAQSGAGFIWRNEVLLYETEAFLFQAKSAVDMLIRVLNPVVPSLAGFDSFRAASGIAGGAVLHALRVNEPALHALLEDARLAWIQDLKEMRDKVTHVSELHGMKFFVENQYHGGPNAAIDFPTLPSGRRLDEYCGDVLDRLMELTARVLDEVAVRAENGQQAS